ncbi:hypothetical protein [Selenomonas sp.]|uniref:hypothetical protein n=1 Tax=Selenomonas sp. TaxID=2053611 RepID=UPI0025F3ED62|nr:hypothetical protein [Selenomonas sp.]MCI6085162.1 hypothetical protein [Selenomonas sp.]MDY3297083.1 hypothetical protein [Selenomonas sp.]MDY4415644.1 hypothetical protein [Selenomonas sp.]
MRKIVYICILALFLTTSLCSAEKYSYENKNFDASHISAVLVVCGLPEAQQQYVNNPFVVQEVYDYVSGQLQDGGIKVYTLPQMTAKINSENHCDIEQMVQTDPDAANAIFAQYSNLYQGLIEISVTAYNTSHSYGYFGGACAGFDMQFENAEKTALILARRESRIRQSDVYHSAQPQGIAERLLKNFCNDVVKKIHSKR